MGEFTDKKEIVFDRQKILDNEDGKLNFWGSFNVNSEIQTNGLDSYGFKQRIYMTDTITRTFGNPNGNGDINEIQTTYDYIEAKNYDSTSRASENVLSSTNVSELIYIK